MSLPAVQSVQQLYNTIEWLSSKGASVLLSYEDREDKQPLIDQFFALIADKFTATEIESHDLHPDYRNLRCRNKSPIFRLSLHLATTDAANSAIVGTGLFINSYLPRVFNVTIGNTCSLLVLEIFRLSSLVASALHLLAMALVYYRGTTNPLHYRCRIC
ncbi:unnamed protein product [Medioppia subpectinata]|uniref:Uncharacterized protein n=1 Tax=Medioppia subpectinata TaxID=1979941 RepID=A0A7R9KWM5_9ACAR|nr:unnamed protein product [Medioppia subpectinata]CAG2111200.1 unnamed protein product [Medioppia subpectinata]